MGCSLTMWDVNSNNQRRFSCKEHELFFNYVGCKFIYEVRGSFSIARCSLTMWDVNTIITL